jgi:hypothetical protein
MLTQMTDEDWEVALTAFDARSPADVHRHWVALSIDQGHWTLKPASRQR